MNAVAPADFDPRRLPASFYDDPYPTYARLREESPVHLCPDGSFFVTRYADAFEVYRDNKRFSSDKARQFGPVFGTDSPLYEHHTSSLVFNDPPLHTRVRRAIGDALSGRAVGDMRPRLEAVVDGLIDGLDPGGFDVICEYAAVIPVEIIGDLLGVPRTERAPLRRWSLAILGALEAGADAEVLRIGNAAVRDFVAYLDEFLARRRETLSEADDDIVARLLRFDDGGEPLSESELYHQCIFLLNAGHETTSNLIGNGVELLIRFPRARAELVADPGLIEGAVEEILRYESSNQLGNRTAVEDVEIGGVAVPAGSIVTLCIGAANRDPERFTHPERFDIHRTDNRHLAFGSGIHTCAGLHVARLEGAVAIGRLLRRYPELLLRGDPERAQRARFRGFSRLRVAAP